MTQVDPYVHLDRLAESDERMSRRYLLMSIAVAIVVGGIAAWYLYSSDNPTEPFALFLSAASPFAVVRIPWQRYAHRRDRVATIEYVSTRLRMLSARDDLPPEQVSAERTRLEGIIERLFLRELGN